MTLELRVMTGSRAGQHERFTKSVVAVGRHPLCDFRFDPAHDLDVSTRHAEIRALGGQYTLFDIGSTNGTFVNGLRVSKDQVLVSGDVVSFGEFGPRVEIVIEPDAAAAAAAAAPAAAAPAAGATRAEPVAAATAAPLGATRNATSTQVKAAADAATETAAKARATRRLLAGAAVVLVACVALAYWLGHRNADVRDAELQRLSRANDSLSHTYAERTALPAGQAQGLDSSLAAAQHQTDAVKTAMSGTRSNERADSLARELHALEARRHAMLSAAQVDYSTIATRSGPAVTLIAVQWPDSSAFSGSGFSITARGEIITNRHLVQRPGNQLPMRIAVIFSDTKAWLPAHVVRASATADLALIQVDAAGPFPAITSIAPRAAATPVGKSVAIIGYPLGTDTPMEGSGTHITARSTLVAGTVSKNLATVLQIDAYAGEGSSGSPVFNTAGEVIGIVYGGARESAGRIVYAVPSDEVAGLTRP